MESQVVSVPCVQRRNGGTRSAAGTVVSMGEEWEQIQIPVGVSSP